MPDGWARDYLDVLEMNKEPREPDVYDWSMVVLLILAGIYLSVRFV